MKKRALTQFPNLDHENELRSQGYDLIAGIDEVGRGALAGPVIAGAVILPYPANLPWLELVRDSKELNCRKRESLFDSINKEAIAVGVGIVPSQVIDSINILKATKLAMMQAVEKLSKKPHFLLIDRVTLSQCPIPQRGITRGDKLCLSIACASIVAKVTRDRMMTEFDRIYPGYGFAHHKGYGTGEHLSCLRNLGPSPIHRLYFAPVRDIIASQGSIPLASCHSEPFTSFHTEPFPFCHSDPSSFCHSDPDPFVSCHPEQSEGSRSTQGRLREGEESDSA
jgi:ribonuclease HII